jgi:opacity protein-like surface antigen
MECDMKRLNTNIKQLGALAVFALIAMTSVAQAQDFKGIYGGIESGIGILDVDGSTIAGPFSENDHSAIVGGIIGYRAPVGSDSRFVLGVEGQLGIYTSGSDLRYGVYGIGGYRVGDNGLLYARIGYSWLDGVANGVGKGIDGLAFGGGYEFGVSEDINLRLDYKYVDYDDIDFADNTMDFDGHEITAAVLFNF